MSKQRFKRIATGVIGSIVVLGLCAALALHLATRALKNQVQQALGSTSEVGEIVVGWSTIELHKVHVRAPSGWPAEETLRADNVVITPDLKALISSKLSISRIDIDAPYISILRTRDGKVRLLPSLLENDAKKSDASTKENATTEKSKGIEVSIGKVEIHDGVIEFFDASIKQPAHKITLEQLNTTVNNIHVPTIAGQTGIELDGKIKGTHQDGNLTIKGWIDIVGKNSEISTQLQGVDLIALEPYLIKASETGVRKGTLDLDLKSTVRDNHLNAPGKVTLTGLELDTGSGAMNTFMGIPRRAAIASLEDRKNQIVVPFTLSGNLDDPHFSLNENLLTHVGTGVAGSLGIGIEGLAHGVGNAAQGVGGMLKKLISK